jgi:hypothetical protein
MYNKVTFVYMATTFIKVSKIHIAMRAKTNLKIVHSIPYD